MKENIHFFNNLVLETKDLLISLEKEAYFIKIHLTIKKVVAG